MLRNPTFHRNCIQNRRPPWSPAASSDVLSLDRGAVDRYLGTRRLLVGFFWAASAVGVVGAIVGVVLTIVMWPNAIGLLLTIYGIAHAIVMAGVAKTAFSQKQSA